MLKTVKMKITSFNVNSLRARLPIVLRWLEEHKPDILCMQETKVQDNDFPCEDFDNIGYNYVFKGEKSYNGVAIVSKNQIEDVQFGFNDEPRDQARLIIARINEVVVVNSYVPQGDNPESEKFIYKLNWFKKLRRLFEENFKPNQPIVWVGDLNIAPLPIDVYDPEGLLGHVCYHPEVQKLLNDVIAWGFVDIFRKYCKEGGKYTFWDYRIANVLKRNLGWRLDHIMATNSLAQKSLGCYIDAEPRKAIRPSDHTPIVAEFEL